MTEATNHNLKEIYEEAYDQFSDAIFRYCHYKTSNREKALDLTQDTFIKTWEYLSSGKEVENLRAFLYRVAGNLIIDDSRKKKADSLDLLTENGFEARDEENELENREKAFEGRIAMETVQKLDDKYRDVIIMRFVEDLEIKEIAKILKESENNVSVKIHRGIEKLKEILSEE